MAATVAVVETTPTSILYSVIEAGTAADVVTRNLLTDLAAQRALPAGCPLAVALDPAAGYADQAAARADFLNKVDVLVHGRVSTVAGATAHAQVRIDQNVSAPAVADNFRLELGAAKAANGDTGTFYVRLVLRHSLVD